MCSEHSNCLRKLWKHLLGGSLGFSSPWFYMLIIMLLDVSFSEVSEFKAEFSHSLEKQSEATAKTTQLFRFS